MSKKIFISVLFCICGSLVASCAAPTYRIYSGEPKDTRDIAAIITNDKFVHCYIWKVDGISPPPGSDRPHYGSGWDGSYRIEVLPGKHTIIVGYLQEPRVSRIVGNNKIITITKLGPTPKAERHPVTFYAEAGKEYRLEQRDDKEQGIGHFEIVEVMK